MYTVVQPLFEQLVVYAWCILIGVASDAPQAGGPHEQSDGGTSVSQPSDEPAKVTAKDLVGKAVTDAGDLPFIDKAIACFTSHDIDGCRAVLQRVCENNPNLPPPGVIMAKLWLSANQLAVARAELEDTAVKFPADPEPYLMLGDFAFQERRVTDSAVCFDEAGKLVRLFAGNPNRKRDLEIRSSAGSAAVAEARKQWPLARTYLAKWLELEPDNASAHQRLGIVLFKLGKETEALASFREAKQLDEKAVQPELALACLYDDARKKDTAKKLIEAAVKAAPKDPAVLLASAQWYLGQNDLETAKATADAALKLEPESLEGRIVRGAIARMARDYKSAQQFLNEAHVQSPLNFPASNCLALVLIESDEAADKQRALEIAEANVAMYRENSPQQVPALTTLAWVFYKLGRQEEAAGILDQISRNNALSTDGAYYLARILSDRGEKDRAQQILEGVLANEPMFATRPDAVELLDNLLSKDTNNKGSGK